MAEADKDKDGTADEPNTDDVTEIATILNGEELTLGAREEHPNNDGELLMTLLMPKTLPESLQELWTHQRLDPKLRVIIQLLEHGNRENLGYGRKIIQNLKEAARKLDEGARDLKTPEARTNQIVDLTTDDKDGGTDNTTTEDKKSAKAKKTTQTTTHHQSRRKADEKVQQRYNLRQGILYSRATDRTNGDAKWLLVIPHALRRRFLEYFHDGSIEGHLDFTKTMSAMRRRVTWDTMSVDLKNYVKNCACQHLRTRKRRGQERGRSDRQ